MKASALGLLAPAILFAAAAAPAQNWAKGTPLSVTVTNDRFAPAQLTMKSGGQYILRLRNASDRKHNFSAPAFFKYARVSPADGRLISDNKVDLEPGQSATLHLVAPDTPNSHYEFRSTNLADAAEKLKGDILVR